MSGIINSIKKVASSSSLQRNAGVPEFSPEMRFSIEPLPGDSGFSQWHSAMKMVSQLPEGIPLEFRKRLWLSLADKHLTAKGINWSLVEKNCFSEWSHPSDAELGVQIVKDLHRTGCSLFCGENGQENQALLKRVLLAYARWNKAVGYCQGFNMLAALMLQVTERCESDALKLMIYLIEGVLPESYFADSLRGLSVDMAVFRELLRTKLPRLSRHLDNLQAAAKEGTTSYEPPLTNVFTMQWFLTLFCNCLPQPTVLRVWDLILLEGNEILLRTSLAIWQVLAERIMTVKSADEFYCLMGVLMREILEYDLIDANTLVKGIVSIGTLTELKTLREHYLYNINPWGSSVTTADPNKSMKLYHKDKLLLDIGVLKKQYTRLKQRQRQAHIIFNSAVARQTTRPAPVAMNHLLLGRKALVPSKRVGPPKGAVPPVRQTIPKTIQWKDTRRDSSSSSSSSSDTELCDDPGHYSSDDEKLQLPHDNPTKSSDTVLMNKDNILCEKSIIVKSCTDDNDSSLNFLSLEVNSKDVSSFDGIPSETVTSDQNLIPSSVNNIFDTQEADNTEVFDFEEMRSLERSDSIPSEDLSFDFERFLQERTKTINDDTSPEDTSEQERVKYARKNSQRALQIIQENSLILHRILQCQSRYTPSPPPLEDESINLFLNNDNLSGDNFLNLQSKFEETDVTPTNDESRVVCDEVRSSDEYESRGFEFYRDSSLIQLDETSDENGPSDFLVSGLIDKSSSLGDLIGKYNLLARDLETPVELDGVFGKEKTEIEEVDFNLIKYRQKLGSPIIEDVGECQEPTMIEIDKNSKYNSILEYSKNLDEKFNHLILNKSSLKFKEASRLNSSLDVPEKESRDFPTSSCSFPNLLSRPKSIENISIEVSRISEVDKPGGSDDLRKSPEQVLSTLATENYESEESSQVFPPAKSPNRIYNPFPVNISSRQNKEVALKLGLYKK